MDDDTFVGRVLRANTRSFACGTHSTRIDHKHAFGTFVKVEITNDDSIHAIGLIHSVDIKDDQLINELVMADGVDDNVLRDQRENRMVPVEISVLNVGYMNGTAIVHSLPPRPPLSLSKVYQCDVNDVLHFTRHTDFFRIVLNASDIPADDLIAAAIRYASWAYEDENERYAFLVHCGRQLARLLSRDLRRLEQILALIKPE
ncbi:MAG: hypothetical protein D6737_08375 [Chloroflexi bacterium]|nr:MAG: hypothetical protein D6737_08375 [Chloroflexota bacterium]